MLNSSPTYVIIRGQRCKYQCHGVAIDQRVGLFATKITVKSKTIIFGLDHHTFSSNMPLRKCEINRGVVRIVQGELFLALSSAIILPLARLALVGTLFNGVKNPCHMSLCIGVLQCLL